jgi:hypothetical protein
MKTRSDTNIGILLVIVVAIIWLTPFPCGWFGW